MSPSSSPGDEQATGEGIGGVLAVAAMVGTVVLCCAGPFLVVAVAGLGIGAWLSAHGPWLLGALGVLVGAAAGLAVYRRSRTAHVCPAGVRGTDRSGHGATGL